jgi:cytochrome P450 family 6
LIILLVGKYITYYNLLQGHHIKSVHTFLSEFNGDILVAQAAIFFTAGFEANATIISFALYELAMQPCIQTRLREEILGAMGENEQKLTYEAVRDMEYLHMVVSGT